MRIIAIKTLRDFWEQPAYRDSEASLKAWYAEAKAAHWKSTDEIKRMYGSASPVGSNRVVFNIKGNKYRLIVKINYDFATIYVRFVGTHRQYDAIDAGSI